MFYIYRSIVVHLLSRRNPALQHCCKDSMRAMINPCSSANPRALLCIKSGLLKHLDTPECCLRPIFWNQSDISQLNLNASFKTELEKNCQLFVRSELLRIFFCNLLLKSSKKSHLLRMSGTFDFFISQHGESTSTPWPCHPFFKFPSSPSCR